MKTSLAVKGPVRRVASVEWKGELNLLGRIEGERCPDGEWQRVKVFARVSDTGPEVEVPLPVVEDWMLEALDEQFAKEVE